MRASVSVLLKNFSGRWKTSGGAGRCQGVRTVLVSVLGAWLPSLLWGESITTPFGFLGAIAVQSTGHQFRMLLAKTRRWRCRGPGRGDGGDPLPQEARCSKGT